MKAPPPPLLPAGALEPAPPMLNAFPSLLLVAATPRAWRTLRQPRGLAPCTMWRQVRGGRPVQGAAGGRDSDSHRCAACSHPAWCPLACHRGRAQCAAAVIRWNEGALCALCALCCAGGRAANRAGARPPCRGRAGHTSTPWSPPLPCQADCWSCGVLLYMMLYASFPFSVDPWGDGGPASEAEQTHQARARAWTACEPRPSDRPPLPACLLAACMQLLPAGAPHAHMLLPRRCCGAWRAASLPSLLAGSVCLRAAAPSSPACWTQTLPRCGCTEVGGTALVPLCACP